MLRWDWPHEIPCPLLWTPIYMAKDKQRKRQRKKIKRILPGEATTAEGDVGEREIQPPRVNVCINWIESYSLKGHLFLLHHLDCIWSPAVVPRQIWKVKITTNLLGFLIFPVFYSGNLNNFQMCWVILWRRRWPITGRIWMAKYWRLFASQEYGRGWWPTTGGTRVGKWWKPDFSRASGISQHTKNLSSLYYFQSRLIYYLRFFKHHYGDWIVMRCSNLSRRIAISWSG